MTAATTRHKSVDRASAMRLNELVNLPCELKYFGPVADPGLHPLLHSDDDGVGFVVGAVLGALLGGPCKRRTRKRGLGLGT